MVDGRTCGQWSNGKEQELVAHLRGQHNVSDALTIQHKLQTCVLAQKWIGSFWCGFCVRVIPNREVFGAEICEQRNKHICDHIEHKINPCKMDDWIEARGRGKTKAESREAMHDASLRSPTVTGGASPEEESSSGGELEEGEEIGNTTIGPPPLRLNINPGMIPDLDYGQNGISSTDTRRPSIVITPADNNYETQNFYSAYQTANERFRPRSYSDQGHNGYPLQQYSRQCSNCLNTFLDTTIGDDSDTSCLQCRNLGMEGTMEAFLNSEEMDQGSAWQT